MQQLGNAVGCEDVREGAEGRGDDEGRGENCWVAAVEKKNDKSEKLLLPFLSSN